MSQPRTMASPVGWARLLPIAVSALVILVIFPALTQSPAWASAAKLEQLKQIPGVGPVVEAAQAAVTAVQEVTQPEATAPAAGSPCAELLQRPNLELRGGSTYLDGPRRDLERGVVNPRLCQLLVDLLDQQPGINLWIKVFKTGHFACVNAAQVQAPNDPTSPGCRVSDHYAASAADVYGVNGPVSANNQAARLVVEWLADQSGPTRPNQIIHPFADIPRDGRHLFAELEHHDDHIHIGGFP